MSRIIKFIILIAALLISFCYFCITVDATSNSLVEVFNEVKEYKADSAFNSQLNTNLFTHIDSIDTKEPKITILTPGATCDIETWGSSLINDSYFFDDNSIINYFIRRNANVYCASFKKSSLKYNDLYCVPYTSSGIPDSLLNGSYNNSDYILDTITMDITKPVVILFSPNNEFEGHHLYNYDGTTYSKPSNTDKSAYEELEAMTNYVIYKYMETYYNAHYLDNDFELKIPRINMIGHSRGGIINMQYAIEHPDIVDSLYSIGTPYNGSSVYDAFNDEGIDVLRIIGEPNNAMADCVNDSIYKALKYYWNEYQSSPGYYHTKLYAIGGSMGFNLLSSLESSLLNDDSIFVKFLRWWFSAYTPLEEYEQFINPTKVDNDVLSTYHKDEKGLLVGEFIDVEDNFDLNGLQNLITSISLYVAGFNDLTTASKRHKAAQVIRGLLESMWFDYQTDQFVAKNDVLVDLSSQQAKGYHNAERFEKIFTNSNSNLLALVVSDLPAVGHNLEPCDEDIINCILSNIVLGDNDNGFNLKYINSSTLEYIGFNYDKAVSNGLLNLEHIYSSYANYQISSKMFDCDYTLAQKLYKNEKFYFSRTVNGACSDGIIEIHFEEDFTFEKNTFAFLKGNVEFSQDINTTLRTLDNNVYNSSNGTLYLNNELIKYYRPNFESNIQLTNVSRINNGAFLCQSIQDIAIQNITINTLEIGEYAFYGCGRLNTVDTNKPITKIGSYAFNNTRLYDQNDYVIVKNALIKADRNTPLIIFGNDPITYVASNAIRTDVSWNYMVIEKDNVYFEEDAIRNPRLESVILYTDEFNLTDDHFQHSSPIIYSYYDVSSSFSELIIRNYFNVMIDSPSNRYNKVLYLTAGYQDPNYTFLPGELIYAGYNVLGYTTTSGNHYIDEVNYTINYFRDTMKVYYMYYECEDNHQYSQMYTVDAFNHAKDCLNCCRVEKENHQLVYQAYGAYSDDLHNEYCSCGYSGRSGHHYHLEATSNATHSLICDDCGHEMDFLHDYEDKYIGIGTELYTGRECSVCGHQLLYNLLTVIDNGDNHILSNGETLDHDYILMEFQGYTIMMCKYCGHHVHNGLIGSSDGDSTHNLYCECCQTVCHMPHVCTEYQNEDSDLFDGYHSKECDLCGATIYEAHLYDVDEAYEDGHHLICSLCGATTIWSHDAASSSNPTPYCHTVYCDYCQCYYYVSHSFEYYDIMDSDNIGHYVICNECGYYKKVSHNNTRYFNASGHYDICDDCGYEGSIIQHIPLFDCTSVDPHDHYMYCSGCSYTLATTLNYTSYHEYAHFCKCSICQLQIVEPHEENCVYYDEELHTYMCYLCDVNYLMPHFVNDHLIIYENYEPGYDLWVCTYCGYMEIRRREE